MHLQAKFKVDCFTSFRRMAIAAGCDSRVVQPPLFFRFLTRDRCKGDMLLLAKRVAEFVTSSVYLALALQPIASSHLQSWRRNCNVHYFSYRNVLK